MILKEYSWLLIVISVMWAVLSWKAFEIGDWKNLLVYGGIFLTNTGLALHALHTV